MTYKRCTAAVIGIGYSEITRDPQHSLGQDAVEACSKALKDAELRIADIDGLSTSTSQPFANAGDIDGVDFVTPEFLSQEMSISGAVWVNGDPGLIGSSFIAAAHALAARKCKYALVWRALSFPKNEAYGLIDPSSATGGSRLTVPYGYTDSGAAAYASVLSRYMARYGAGRGDMATLVVNSRHNALLNPHAYHRSQALAHDEYLRAPFVAEPLCIHDSDVPVQACIAYVLTTADRARSAPSAAYLVGYGQAGAASAGLRQFAGALESYQEAARLIGHSLWESTGLTVADIDTANLYDGFSPFVYLYLEGLGFCAEGEAYEFVKSGRIALGGELPLNTSGGSLGEGRVHGAAHISEAVLQAMGRAGSRQVQGVSIALSTVGFRHGGLGQAMLFSRECL
ncbi:thiolase family protein [Dehalococcoidia bacterium]|nr:thiolase family protein [Dehalococcoidia bacterium]